MTLVEFRANQGFFPLTQAKAALVVLYLSRKPHDNLGKIRTWLDLTDVMMQV